MASDWSTDWSSDLWLVLASPWRGWWPATWGTSGPSPSASRTRGRRPRSPGQRQGFFCPSWGPISVHDLIKAQSKGLIKFDCNQNLINVESFSWDKSRSRQTMNGREGFVLFWDLVSCPLSHALVYPQLDRQSQNGSNSSVVLYLGLSVSSVGLIIFLVGVGEKGFKSLELQLIGPSLIGEPWTISFLSSYLCTVSAVQINMPIFLQYVFL